MAPATSSTRWCPTPGQLMILEEMYRSGIRSPKASQIQQITAHLSLHGKIEGKNVFYWFQNHKAREKQKLRRKLGKLLHHKQQLYLHQQLQHGQPNHHLIRYFDSPASLLLQQLSDFTSARFPTQGGQSENAPQQTMNQTWNVNMPARVEMVKSLMGMCSPDWVMMVDAAPTSPCCTRPPLKTLELFPITATNLKEECSSSN